MILTGMANETRFEQTMHEVYGARGDDWLARLPETPAARAARWQLDLAPPFANLTYNYVAPATLRDGARAVPKLGVPNKELTAEADALFVELIASSAAPVLPHGDLHHDNILDAGGGRWLAIDPKGVIGDGAYGTRVLLRNPRGLERWPHLDRVLTRRLRLLSDLFGFEVERLRAWSFAQLLLSAWWSIEDHGYGWQPAVALAERFQELSL